jgi:hypothetical protein
MADSNAISAHGTIIKRNGTPIGELRDITPPPLTRKMIETTSQNSDDDSAVVGIRRKGEMQFQIGFLPSGDSTHGPLSGLIKAWHDGSKDCYEIAYPQGEGGLVFSGYVTNIGPRAPVDDGLEAAVSIKPTNGHIFR